MRIRVLLVEDHVMVRQGLRALLSGSPDFEIVGETSDGNDIALLVDELTPDVVVTDLSLGSRGIEATMQMIKRVKTISGARVVVLSMHTQPEVVARAREAGADSYVVKGADVSELGRAIRTTLDGTPYFSSEIAAATGEPGPTPLSRLSGREREVLKHVAEGCTNKEIAKRLGISVHTVNAHRVSLMAKLDLHDAQGLTRFALRHGLVAVD